MNSIWLPVTAWVWLSQLCICFMLQLDGMQVQMSSKGGYEHTQPVESSVEVVDIQRPEVI